MATTTNAFPLTFDAVFVEPARYAIDGTQVRRVTEELATADTLSLTWRVASADELATLRALQNDEGKVAILASDDGGHIAIDRAGGSNTVTLTPPQRRQPLRQERIAHVERYEESLVEQRTEVWTVEIDFVLGSDRTDEPSINETKATNGWAFDTRYGTIATSRVDADVTATGEEGVTQVDLIARLTSAQAHVFEAAFARVRGSRVKTIPDAPNIVRDETGGDMTVGVRTPSDQDAVSDGDYVVAEWESERITDAFQQFSVTLIAA